MPLPDAHESSPGPNDLLVVHNLNQCHTDPFLDNFVADITDPHESDATDHDYELFVSSILDEDADPILDDFPTDSVADHDHILRSISALGHDLDLPSSGEIPLQVQSLPSSSVSIDTLDDRLSQLYASAPLMRRRKLSLSAFYRDLDIHSLNENGKVLSQTMAHVDGGSQATTTAHKFLLFGYRPFTTSDKVPALRVADNRPHYPIGVGYLKVPKLGSSGRSFEFVRCFHTPTLPATILSPDKAGREHGCAGYLAVSMFHTSTNRRCALHLLHCKRTSQDIRFPLISRGGLLYTEALIRPTSSEHTAPLPTVDLPLPQATSPWEGVQTVSSSPIPLCGASCRFTAHLEPNKPGFSPISRPVSREGIPSSPDSRSREGHLLSAHESREGNGSREGPSSTPCVCQLASREDSPEVPTHELHVAALTREQQRLLWHQRLGHLHFKRLSAAAKQAYGLPSIVSATCPIGDACPVCQSEKLTKAARRKTDSRKATQCYQGLSIDFGFVVQKSKNEKRLSRLTGLNGETCYVLIADHHSGALHGATFVSKHPPIEYLNRWLARHDPGTAVANKYVRVDQGGDLGGSSEFRRLFEEAGYTVEPTAPDSSSQNGPGERPHRTIKDALRTMLHGAGMELHFWPYAFQHYLRLYNLVPHGNRDKSAYEICTGRKPNLGQLRTFGCRVRIIPPRTKRPNALEHGTRIGRFLGFTKTLRNIFYYDEETHQVNDAQHVAFDEGFSDLSMNEKPPNAKMLFTFDTLDKEGTKTVQDEMDLRREEINLDIVPTPFISERIVSVPVDPKAENPLGFTVTRCPDFRRAVVDYVNIGNTKNQKRTFTKALGGRYILAIGDTVTFSRDDVDNAISNLLQSPEVPSHVDVTVALEYAERRGTRKEPALHLQVDTLRRVTAINSISGEGLTSREYAAALQEAEDKMTNDIVREGRTSVPTANLIDLDGRPVTLESNETLLSPDEDSATEQDESARINRLQVQDMTDEERALPKFTRRRLKRLSNWDIWDAAFDKQLDSHFKSGAINHPVPRPISTKLNPSHILRIQWANIVKDNGDRKARACIDGSKRSAPTLRELAQTYASCIDTTCMRLFFALCAQQGLIITSADTENAYQQSPGPTVPCYLEIDDAVISWYKKRFNKVLDPRTHVIPVRKALQGHPEAGRLWEKHITSFLVDKLGFRNTTHERNLYIGTIDNELVIICRQVDDFSVGAKTKATADKLIALINDFATTKNQGVGEKRDGGMWMKYNGMDIHQTRHFVKLSCETYIQRILQTHGWETPDQAEAGASVPLSEELAKKCLEAKIEDCPKEGSTEHQDLQESMGFSYRQLLGELTYAYVICRPDIGYAVTMLSRFSTAPHRDHYLGLTRIAKYLRQTIHWGIVYWREQARMDLPEAAFDLASVNPTLPEFPSIPLDELAGFCDAAYATDVRTRRSVTGYAFTFAGGAVAYKSKLQPVVSLSSSEAEFYAAVQASKCALYLRMVLNELGFLKKGATTLHIDNQACVHMINDNKPTSRTRHVWIHWFAIQEWRQRQLIKAINLPGVILPADGLTKAVGTTLHTRHARRMMGHYGRSRQRA